MNTYLIGTDVLARSQDSPWGVLFVLAAVLLPAALLALAVAMVWARMQARRHGPAILTAGALAACRTEPYDAPADASTVDAALVPDMARPLDFSTVADAASADADTDGGKCGTVGDVCANTPCCVGAVILKCCSDSICALDC